MYHPGPKPLNEPWGTTGASWYLHRACRRLEQTRRNRTSNGLFFYKIRVHYNKITLVLNSTNGHGALLEEHTESRKTHFVCSPRGPAEFQPKVPILFVVVSKKRKHQQERSSPTAQRILNRVLVSPRQVQRRCAEHGERS